MSPNKPAGSAVGTYGVPGRHVDAGATAIGAHQVAVNAEHGLLHALPQLSAALVHADPQPQGDTLGQGGANRTMRKACSGVGITADCETAGETASRGPLTFPAVDSRHGLPALLAWSDMTARIIAGKRASTDTQAAVRVGHYQASRTPGLP